MKKLKGNDTAGSAARVYWTDLEWEDFSGTFLVLYPERNTQDHDFRLKRDEFDTVQKRIISFDRQRPIHQDVLVKATKKTAPIFQRLLSEGNHISQAELALRDVSRWTEDEYVLIANRLHITRSDLNLLFADQPSGFSAEDFREALKALPASRRYDVESIDLLTSPLKKAYLRIREGSDEPTFTFATPDDELIVVGASEMAETAKGRRVTWKDDDLYKLAKVIHRRNPKADYISSQDLAALRAAEVFEAQSEALSIERRRTQNQISQGMVKLRTALLPQFAILKRDLLENNFSVLAQTAGKPVHVEAANNALPSTTENPKAVTMRRAPPLIATNGQQAKLSEKGATPHGYGREESSSNLSASTITEAALDIASKADSEGGASSNRFKSTTLEAMQLFAAPSDTPASQVSSSHGASEPTDIANKVSDAMLQAIRPLIEAVAAEFAKALAAAVVPQVAEILRREQLVSAPLPTPIATAASGSATPSRQAAVTAEPAFERAKDASEYPAPIEHDEEEDAHFPNGNIAVPQQDYLIDENLDEDPLDSLRLQDPNLHQSRNPAKTGHLRPTTSGRTPVGIVGVKHKHAEELESLYPDIAFTCVDNTSHEIMGALLRCVKVIGVEGYIPPLADGLLDKTLRGRYERVSGGLPKVKQQLATWIRSGIIPTPVHA